MTHTSPHMSWIVALQDHWVGGKAVCVQVGACRLGRCGEGGNGGQSHELGITKWDRFGCSLDRLHSKRCSATNACMCLQQVGDVLDRGDEELRILYFLERLQAEAKAAGGQLYVLNGK